MQDQLPPVSPGKVRVIVHEGAKDRLVCEMPTEGLPAFLDGLSDLTDAPMVQGTPDGALMAAWLYRRAQQQSHFGIVACCAALWVCLYGDALPPGIGLSIDDLRKATGHGVMTIRVSPDHRIWEYEVAKRDGSIGGRVTVDAPHWARETMGTA